MTPQARCKAALALEKEQRQRENDRRKEEAAKVKERERREQTVSKAQAVLEQGKRDHDRRAATLEIERAALEKCSRVEEARWQRQRSKLKTALRRREAGRSARSRRLTRAQASRRGICSRLFQDSGRLNQFSSGSFAMARRSIISMHLPQIISPWPAGGSRTTSSSGANSSSQWSQRMLSSILHLPMCEVGGSANEVTVLKRHFAMTRN